MSSICKECSTIKPVKTSQAKLDATTNCKALLFKNRLKRILLALQ